MSRNRLLGMALLVAIGLGSSLVPNYLRAQHRGKMLSCRQNMFLLGTAAAAYAREHGGEPPTHLGQLGVAPVCPNGGNYLFLKDSRAGRTRFVIRCDADHHQEHRGFPHYDSERGLVDSPG